MSRSDRYFLLFFRRPPIFFSVSYLHPPPLGSVMGYTNSILVMKGLMNHSKHDAKYVSLAIHTFTWVNDDDCPGIVQSFISQKEKMVFLSLCWAGRRNRKCQKVNGKLQKL